MFENVYSLCGLENVINFVSDSCIVVYVFIVCDKSSCCYTMAHYF